MMPALCALVYGVIAALLYRRLTDAAKLRQTINRILAHIMEFRLFVDEPALIWRAQRGAIRANLVLLRQIALPSAIMAIAFAFAYQPMNRAFGHGPLRIGESTVMTARTDSLPRIDGIVVETPGVRVARTGEVSWRVRPVSAQTGRIPAGVEIRYPQNPWWLLWFFLFSSAGAAATTLLARHRSDRE